VRAEGRPTFTLGDVTRDTVSWEGLRLETERLCLRPPTLQDAEALLGLFGDPEVMRGLGKEAISAPEGAQVMIESGIDGWKADGVGPFLIETAAVNRQVVGQAGLMIFDTRGWTPSSRSAAGTYAQPELGWALIRDHWGHGYATEAAAAIREWAYRLRSLDRLVSLISPDNDRSQRVARRLGAVPTETITPVDSQRTAVVWRHPPVGSA
jgi:RimJ/RimL family protein N-acetyltransferase